MAEASPTFSSGLDEEELMCGICYESYDVSDHLPKFLVCHHSFCVSCLQVRPRQSCRLLLFSHYCSSPEYFKLLILSTGICQGREDFLSQQVSGGNPSSREEG